MLNYFITVAIVTFKDYLIVRTHLGREAFLILRTSSTLVFFRSKVTLTLPAYCCKENIVSCTFLTRLVTVLTLTTVIKSSV